VSFTPDPDLVRQYEANRYPYVEARIQTGRIHARVLSWQGDMILVQFPPRVAAGTFEGEPEQEWVHKTAARRIRRADALWAHTDDDLGWHQAQD